MLAIDTKLLGGAHDVLRSSVAEPLLHRVQGGGWRLLQYNLLMAIPNDAALGVAAAVGKGVFR